MIKKLLLFSFCISLTSCSSVKKTQEAINYGNYDQAINIAVKELRRNKIKKGNQEYVFMLEEAFDKATIKDLEAISFLEKESNLANLEVIYNKYLNLKNRQELIKPLLPLPIHNKSRNAKFSFKDYSTSILTTKNRLSDYLYAKAKESLISSTNKIDFRNAFDDLNYLNKINPGYKDINYLIEEAHFKGMTFIFVSLKNQTDSVIPMRLEADLLNFDTYKLQDLWTVYHNNRQPQINYDYKLSVNFREINISPEQIREKQLIKEKQVVDGWKYLTDNNGAIVKDSLGNKIKVDKFKTITCKIKEITQFKSVQVVGQIQYFNLGTNQLIQSFPLSSDYIFENHYGTYIGNKNALEKVQLDLLANSHVPFPSNEQMVYDSSESLKNKIKNIITQNRLGY
ncbi:hypothetical protein [Lutibacter sp.]|uniref:hypothetical protein n=1 Tax=Lutibacter sp. TaxID=1925666 RepID=UPI003569ED60